MSWMLFSVSTASEPLPCYLSHFADAISSCTERPLGVDRSGNCGFNRWMQQIGETAGRDSFLPCKIDKGSRDPML
jgi:hypothetical protein